MTNNFKKDINIPSKEIIVEFSDGYCIVLENNKISMRKNVFTKLQIVFGKRTNELLEFVKELYLNKKAKEQECKELNLTNERLVAKKYALNEEILRLEKQVIQYKQALDEIENYVRDNSDFDKSDKLTSNTGAYDILEIINKAKKGGGIMTDKELKNN